MNYGGIRKASNRVGKTKPIYYVIFFTEMRNMEEKWRTSILVSGLITFIAAVHYYYMRDYFTATSTSPT